MNNVGRRGIRFLRDWIYSTTSSVNQGSCSTNNLGESFSFSLLQQLLANHWSGWMVRTVTQPPAGFRNEDFISGFILLMVLSIPRVVSPSREALRKSQVFVCVVGEGEDLFPSSLGVHYEITSPSVRKYPLFFSNCLMNPRMQGANSFFVMWQPSLVKRLIKTLSGFYTQLNQKN